MIRKSVKAFIILSIVILLFIIPNIALAQPSIPKAAVFESYLETGDMLFCIEGNNTEAPYYSDDPIQNYWDLQLWDSGNTTLIASTPMRQWGDRPSSLYLSADQAAGLTSGSTYNLRIIGNYTGAASVSYQLTTADWKGTDKYRLDDWMRGVATSMETTDSATYLVLSSETNTYVFNDESGSMFELGIPALKDVRPDMFLVSLQGTQYNEKTWTNAFTTSRNWETVMGADLVARLNAAGGLISLSGKQLFTWIFVAMFGLAVVSLALFSSGVMSLMIAMPLLLMGAWIGVVPIAPLLVLALIGGFFIAVLILSRFV